MGAARIRLALALLLLLVCVATATTDPPGVPPADGSSSSPATDGSTAAPSSTKPSLAEYLAGEENELIQETTEGFIFFIILMLGFLAFLDVMCMCNGAANG